MPLFQSEAERQRKENLKRMEEKRLRFAEALEARGFRPERMLFCSREDGSFAALARHEGKLALIDGPKFGQEGEFTLELLERPVFDRQEVFEKGTGLNGAFGFGTKAARGFDLFIRNGDGLYVKLPVIAGRNSWLEANYKKNPLLKAKRRRGDANIVWEFSPIDGQAVRFIDLQLREYYLADGDTDAGRPIQSEAKPGGAEAFYVELKNAVAREGLDQHTRVNFGDMNSQDNCLNVIWRAADDCELCYIVEGGQTGYHEEHLSPEQAKEKCLAFLRRRKEFEEYMRGN